MRIFVIGSGGREHALVWKLAHSPRVKRLWCAPGNAGISEERLRDGTPVECAAIGAEDLGALRDFALAQRLELTIVAPDTPLALVIVDFFQERGLPIWGPHRSAARFEASKVFAQEFLARHGIPHPRGGVFREPEAARRFAESSGGGC